MALGHVHAREGHPPETPQHNVAHPPEGCDNDNPCCRRAAPQHCGGGARGKAGSQIKLTMPRKAGSQVKMMIPMHMKLQMKVRVKLRMKRKLKIAGGGADVNQDGEDTQDEDERKYVKFCADEDGAGETTASEYCKRFSSHVRLSLAGTSVFIFPRG